MLSWETSVEALRTQSPSFRYHHLLCHILSTTMQCWSPLSSPGSQSCPPLVLGHSCCSSFPHTSFNNLFSGPCHVLLSGPFILCFPGLSPNQFSHGVLPGPLDHLLLFALPSELGSLNFAACCPILAWCLHPSELL